MSIIAIIKEALRIARAHKSLWLFGLVVGVSVFNGGGGGGGEPPAVPPVAVAPEPGRIALVVVLVLVVVVGFVVVRLVSTGALIEGVKRARHDGKMTVREGFREGWAHWGVLFRVMLFYVLVGVISGAVLVGTCMLAVRAFGPTAWFVVGGPVALIAVPWFLTLTMWQAFAERIAVLENRRALDAIAKARLFLHGRLRLGLKLIVADFLGVLFIGAIGAAVIGSIVLLLIGSAAVVGTLPAAAVGLLTVLPLVLIAIALAGIMTSSVWTIGYLTQVEQ